MNYYFTISRFARLRGIDINSLRYYERLGILIPAYTDPRTRYRYYTAEQLSDLDMILLCINLGIPLKRLTSYMDENGSFRGRALFEEGKRMAEEKIRNLQNSLRGIERTLTYLEQAGRYAGLEGAYSRVIPQRRLVAAEFRGNLNSVNEMETAYSALHTYAREHNLYPVMPVGLLFRYAHGKPARYIYWEISDPLLSGERIVTLPRAQYQCLQVIWQPELDMQSLVESAFEIPDRATVIISSTGPSRLRFGVKSGEAQLLRREIDWPDGAGPL